MKYADFGEYLRERLRLLASGERADEEQTQLGQAIMLEEDDLLEWKAAEEMLENWLGLRQEIDA